MENKQIIIKDYFNILRDEYGRIYCIQEIGDPKSLIKAIREQNEYIQAKEQECEELKKTIMYKCPQCGEKYLSPIGASLYEENNKLKQTLAEIKEIAKEKANINDWLALEILQKISECEVENAR